MFIFCRWRFVGAGSGRNKADEIADIESDEQFQLAEGTEFPRDAKRFRFADVNWHKQVHEIKGGRSTTTRLRLR